MSSAPSGETLNRLPQGRSPSQRKRTWLRRLGYWLGAHVLHLSLRFLWLSYRIEVVREDSNNEVEGERPAVLCFWHEHLVCGSWFTWKHVFRRGVPCAALISPSVDGDVVAHTIHIFGGNVVRGSATRSGMQALRTMISTVRELSSSIMLVVDGPRGPARKLKPGAIALASATGAPIVPLSFASQSEWRIGSWDRTRIPRPFSRVRVLVGRPIEVPRELSADETEAERLRVEETLNRLTDSASEVFSG